MKIALLIPPSKYAKNVARDLVYGCWCKGKRIAGINFPPLSLISVGTVLKKEGVQAELIDAAALGLSIKELLRKIHDYRVVIMLTSSMTLNEDAGILTELKKTNPGLKSIVFGGHVTAEPESTLTRTGIDIVVRREADYIIRDLIKGLNQSGDIWKKTKGIAYMENGECRINPDYPLIENLDELPIPDRSMLPPNLDYFNPVVKRMPYTTMFTSRGCPGQCIFCSSPTFYGRKIRFRSAGRVLEELKEVTRLGYREVFFRDEIFTISRKRVIEVCEGILNESLNLTWVCSARVGTVDFEMMQLMKRAGCHMLRLGVESGVQELLDNVKKGITVEQTRQTLDWAHRAGIDVHAHMMIGLIGETSETLRQTLKFIKEIEPTIVTFGIMTPYAGTPVFEGLRKEHPEIGDGTTMDLSQLHTSAFYNEYFTNLTKEELSRYIRLVYRSFYLRPSYLWKWLWRIKSLDELKRVILAGTQVLDFTLGRD